MLVEWLKKAPAYVTVTVIICCFVTIALVLGGFIILSVTGQDTTEYRSFVNTLANLLLFPFVGVGTVAAVSAARSASRAEDQTNGQLTNRDQHIAELQQQIQRAGLRPVPPPNHEG